MKERCYHAVAGSIFTEISVGHLPINSTASLAEYPDAAQRQVPGP